jgi:peptide-methionine (S)-S-oxide reductase
MHRQRGVSAPASGPGLQSARGQTRPGDGCARRRLFLGSSGRTGTTGHAESVKITFDPKVISYGEILRIYFSVATDPTQLNKQFPDEGPQYRGDIFYSDAAQKAVAERYIAQLNAAKIFHGPIVTRLDPATGFFKAEAYHQDYLVRHPDADYIATFDMPKVAALKALFPGEYRAAPVTAL